MRIRGKLQNFAKAAILAITQKNCSTPCTLFCRPALATPLNNVRFYRHYMKARPQAQTVMQNKQNYLYTYHLLINSIA
ncbi:hypothetical protein DJ480_24845 [Pseudomonas sp. Leaf98]|nr:hypothetical protein DJ480_24845 [Pseudomonas sp. Leaf98]